MQVNTLHLGGKIKDSRRPPLGFILVNVMTSRLLASLDSGTRESGLKQEAAYQASTLSSWCRTSGTVYLRPRIPPRAVSSPRVVL